MIGDISRAEHIYIVCGYTDMRKAIDDLQLLYSRISSLMYFQAACFFSAESDVTE